MNDIDDNMQYISIASVGDISFRGRHENTPNLAIFKYFKPLFEKADLVVANLESPLVSDTTDAIPGKCTLRGATKWADILNSSGVSLVSLANNHMMDYGVSGLSSTLQELNERGIIHVGAGMDAESAYSPVFKEISGVKLAFLGRCSVEVSTPCYAGDNQPGVAFLDLEELIHSVDRLKDNVDHVVVMLHWGIEDYNYPTPQQRQIAKDIASAGATILLGHHPHVLQGEERINSSVVSYSSGNFLFDNFVWSIKNNHDINTINYKLKKTNRDGMLLELQISHDKQIITKPTFSKISEDCIIEIDNSSLRQKQYRNLCNHLHYPLYNFLWKLYSVKQEWNLRLSKEFSLQRIIRNFYKIRPRHFYDLYVKFRRSAKLSSGKSTNPYED